ncbi:MAG TPA: hypothetical protein PKE04_04135, partial [Clostridia bacterium]|nr:hypothetical protein [Clostridia bacterium]
MKKAVVERLLLGMLALLLFIPFLRPSALYRQGGTFVMLMNVYRLAASALALPIWLLFFKRPSPMLCLIALYQAWLCVCTALGGGNWTDAAQTALYTIAFCVLVEWLLRHDPALLYAALLPLLETIVLVNLATLLLFPSGLYTYVGY